MNIYSNLKLLAISTIASIFYAIILFSNSLLYGIDGAYYLVQAKSIDIYGGLRYPDPPLVFYFFYLLSKLFNSYMVGIKVGLVLIVFLSSFPLYYVLKVNGVRESVAMFSVIIYYFSPGFLRLIGDFLKNFVGLLFVSSAILFLSIYIKRKDKKAFIVFLTFILLSALTHILCFFLSILFSYLYLIFSLSRKKIKECLATLSILTAFLAVIVFTGIFFFRYYFSDIFKIESLINEMTNKVSRRFMPPLINQELAFGLPFLLVYVVGFVLLFKAKSKRTRPLLLSSIVIGILMMLPIIPGNFLWRFLIVEFFMGSLATGTSMEISSEKEIIAIVLLMLLLISYFIATQPRVMLLPRVINYRDYIDLKRLVKYIPRNSVVVAITPANYWVEYLCMDKNVTVLRTMNKSADFFVYDLVVRRPVPMGIPIVRFGRFILIKRPGYIKY